MNKNYIKNIIFLIFISIIFKSCASTTKDVKQFNYIDGKSKESFYSNLKEDDLLKATKTLLFALENNSDGQKLNWKNKKNAGYIIPTVTYINNEGYFCRNYAEVLINSGGYIVYNNKACRDHDGEWIWLDTRILNPTSL